MEHLLDAKARVTDVIFVNDAMILAGSLKFFLKLLRHCRGWQSPWDLDLLGQDQGIGVWRLTG